MRIRVFAGAMALYARSGGHEFKAHPLCVLPHRIRSSVGAACDSKEGITMSVENAASEDVTNMCSSRNRKSYARYTRADTSDGCEGGRSKPGAAPECCSWRGAQKHHCRASAGRVGGRHARH